MKKKCSLDSTCSEDSMYEHCPGPEILLHRENFLIYNKKVFSQRSQFDQLTKYSIPVNDTFICCKIWFLREEKNSLKNLKNPHFLRCLSALCQPTQLQSGRRAPKTQRSPLRSCQGNTERKNVIFYLIHQLSIYMAK